MSDCRICGWPKAAYLHRGSVDCINAYRKYVEELRGLLPRGEQVMSAFLARGTTTQLWIDGPITHAGLERLITMIRSMQEAWTEEEGPKVDALDPSLANEPKGEAFDSEQSVPQEKVNTMDDFKCDICTYKSDTLCFICWMPYCTGHLRSKAHPCIRFVSQGEDIVLRIEKLEKQVAAIDEYLKNSGAAIRDFLGTTRATSRS